MEFKWFVENESKDSNSTTLSKEAVGEKIDIQSKPKEKPSLPVKWVNYKNKEDIHAYLNEHAKGRNIPNILEDVKSYLQSEEFVYVDYWYFIDALVSYQASLFLATLAKNSPDEKVIPECDESILSEIVRDAFGTEDKISHALNLIRPCRKQLSYQQVEIIIRSCVKTHNPDLIGEVFLFLDISPSIAINVLKTNLNNLAAAYALYKYYSAAKTKNLITQETVVEVFSYPYISSLIKELEGMDAPRQVIGKLISNIVFGNGYKIDRNLLILINKRGYQGYACYFTQKNHKQEIQERVRNISFTKTYDFLVIKRLPHHYLLKCSLLDSRALLPLSSMIGKENPSKNTQIKAYILKVFKYPKILLVYQREQDHNEYLLNIGDKIDISFSLRNSKIIPRSRNLADLIDVSITNIEFVRNYKDRYIGEVVKQNSMFSYEIRLLGVKQDNNYSK